MYLGIAAGCPAGRQEHVDKCVQSSLPGGLLYLAHTHVFQAGLNKATYTSQIFAKYLSD